MTVQDEYFLAVVPPADLSGQITLLKNHIRETYRSGAALRSPPHITLHMPFRWSTSREIELQNSLTFFARSQTALRVELNDFGCFKPRVIFLRVKENPELKSLESSLHKFMKVRFNIFNARYGDRPFHPHLTIAFRDLKKAEFTSAWKEFESKEFRAEFSAEALTLLKHDGRQWLIQKQFPFSPA